jgi:hypothetical protein
VPEIDVFAGAAEEFRAEPAWGIGAAGERVDAEPRLPAAAAPSRQAHHDRELAKRTRLRLWTEHLELPVEEIPADPIQAIDELWKPISAEQLQRRDDHQPLTHRLVWLPNVSSRTARALGPVTGLLVDG